MGRNYTVAGAGLTWHLFQLDEIDVLVLELDVWHLSCSCLILCGKKSCWRAISDVIRGLGVFTYNRVQLDLKKFARKGLWIDSTVWLIDHVVQVLLP